MRVRCSMVLLISRAQDIMTPLNLFFMCVRVWCECRVCGLYACKLYQIKRKKKNWCRTAMAHGNVLTRIVVVFLQCIIELVMVGFNSISLPPRPVQAVVLFLYLLAVAEPLPGHPGQPAGLVSDS